MPNHANFWRNSVFTAALAAAAVLGAGRAQAGTDPVPGDLIAPPLNVNIGLLYNYFNDAGSFGSIRGADVKNNTHISDDIVVARYIRTFSLGTTEVGVQAFLPYVQFIGDQELGIANIPPFGQGHAVLTHSSGFAQPVFGVFGFPINNPDTGTYAVIAPWISPPVSSFNKNDNLNPGQNTWVYELEVGFRTTLLGTPKTSNLSVEFWGEGYEYGNNGNSAAVSPEVFANAIPFALAPASVTPAKFREQPSAEFRVYVPYEFYPATDAFFAPGFYQSFGGKQTYRISEGPFTINADSGNRTDETQLRFVLASFVSPSMQVMAVGDYDIAAHGEPLNRVFEVRIAKFF